MDVTQQGIVTLLKSALTGQKLELPADFSLDEAYSLISKQGLVTLAYQGAVNCGVSRELPIMQRLLHHYYRLLIRSERQMRAVERICQAFEEQGIDYLPVKGCVMKQLYPKPELRTMGDADILIRLEQYSRIQRILVDLGYDEQGESHHELIWNSEDLHLELHKCLFAATEKDFYAYFADGWDMAVNTVGTHYTLSGEDMFVYLFTHMTKHYRYSGIGSRHILDLYVFRRAYPRLDEAYIETAMEKLHLLEFYQNILRLLEVWFDGAETDEKTDYIGQYILSGGSWGDLATRFSSEQVKKQAEAGAGGRGRFRTIVEAVFPPLEKLQYDYRILFKYPWLYPLFWIPRWVKGLLTRPGEIMRKMKVMRETTDDKVSARKQALNYVGLDFYNE